jgi:ankyrin repeat protein
MSDTLPLPPRPNLEHYRKLAKELQRACRAVEPTAIRDWAADWVRTLAALRRKDARRLRMEVTQHWWETPEEVARESEALARRWRRLTATPPRAGRCQLSDAQFFIAREHGFASWPAFVAHLKGLAQDHSPIAAFESAVDAIVAGDVATLERLLRAHPDLARARSTRDHRSTLLHYVSANGVEDFRQQTPPNIVAITTLLLDAGAEVDASSEAYGGGSTALGLVATSVHPEEAGVQLELLELLLARGAQVEQPGQSGNQHSIVWGCLANGQGRAARFFADRGAPLTLREAAGVGRPDVVRRSFDEQGQLVNGVDRTELEVAFLYACGYGHADVARYLLDRGANPDVANDRGETPLHWAMWGPHLDIVELLLARGVRLDGRDVARQATPLDWAVSAWARASTTLERDRAREATARLVRAGAVPALDRVDARLLRAIDADRDMRQALGRPPAPSST